MRAAVIRIAALTLAASACGGRSDSSADSAATANLPCSGGSGGGFRLTNRADVVYSVSFSDTTGTEAMHINAVFVGRGAPGWKDKAENRIAGPPPARPDSVSGGSGATLGRFHMTHDRANNIAWVHDQPVRLDTFNVVLVDRADSAGGPPVVAGRLRVKPDITLPAGACGARTRATGMSWSDSLRAVLLRNPEVRAFANP